MQVAQRYSDYFPGPENGCSCLSVRLTTTNDMQSQVLALAYQRSYRPVRACADCEKLSPSLIYLLTR